MNQLKNNKASTTIPKFYTYVILVIITAFAVDLLILMTTTVLVGREVSMLSKKLSVQGGFIGSGGSVNSDGEPVYKLSNSHKYNAEFVSWLNDDFKVIGVGQSDWSLYAKEGEARHYIYKNGYMGTGGYEYVSPYRIVDDPSSPLTKSKGFGKTQSVVLEVTFTWRLVGRIFPSNFRPTLTFEVSYTSDYFR